MNTIIHEKNLIRKEVVRLDHLKKPYKKTIVDVIEDQSKKIESYMVDGSIDFLWYLLNSAIPEQVPYCPKCIKAGRNGERRGGRCIFHKKDILKRAFKPLTEEQIETNLNFVKRASWLVSSVCDASPRRIDDKKIIKGIIDINTKNKNSTIKAITKRLTRNK